MPSRPRRDRGAAAVEFALVLPFLLLITFGIIDFGRMFNAQLTTTQAAREGARVAMLGGSDAEVAERVNWAVGADGVASPRAFESCEDDLDPGDDGVTYVEVIVDYQFTFATPIGFLLGDDTTKSLTGRGYMPCGG